MHSTVRNKLLAAASLIFALSATPLSAQFAPEPQKQLPPPAVNWTGEQDHQNMMDQLGIKALRPGPSGNDNAPNRANYDESKANPYPDLPDPLTLKNGKKVTTAEEWRQQRRPEIEHDMQEYVYGFVPKNAPQVTWTVKIVDHEMVGRIPVVAKQLTGHVDNSAYPLIDVNIDMVLVTPANAKGPVPVLMMFGRPSLPAPAQPNPDALAKINEVLRETLPGICAISACGDGALWRPWRGATGSSDYAGIASCRRSSDDAAASCRWLGLCNDQSHQHSSGQWGRHHPRSDWPGE